MAKTVRTQTRATQQSPLRIVLNGAFRGQRITGQQRYATEVARELLKRPGVSELRPPVKIQESRILSWLWALTVNLRLEKGELLLTLTSRGPLWSRRQALIVHDLFVLDHPEWYSRIYRLTHDPVLRLQIKSARLLFTVSEPVGNQVQRRFKLTNRPVTAPNAPSDVFLKKNTRPDILESLGLEKGKFFLTVGSRDPRKNVARLIQAYCRLPDAVREEFPLAVVGGSSSVFRTEGSQTDEPVGVLKVGYVSDEELAQLYSDALAFVFPALDEGFGLPLVEALAAGASVYSSDIEVLRWVGGDAVSYFDPYDVSGISSALLDAVSKNTESRPQTVAPGAFRGSGHERFSWAKTAETIYSTIMSGLDR